MGSLVATCNLHYADDFLILIMGDREDLRLVKLILYVVEEMTGLEANFSKMCMYSSNVGSLPSEAATATLNCAMGLLLVTYLGIPISGRRPPRQDWEGLIEKVRRRVSF